MLSVIICTYNRQKYIYNCLKSIAENDFDASKYEILVVNNNSTDDTEGECRRFGSDYPHINFSVCCETSQGLSYARNRGIEEAKGDILVYVDDDATVNREYLSTIADFFDRYPDAMAAGGAIYPVYETEEPKWMSKYTRELITAYKDEGRRVIRMTGSRFPSGGNAAYRREVFERVGRFDPALGRRGNLLISGEEKAVFYSMKRLDMPIYYLPSMILYHIIPQSKLTKQYFDNLTLSIGRSERLRTLSVSKAVFGKRLVAEGIKWIATIILGIGLTLRLSPEKAAKIFAFRRNVTRGLLGH